MRVITGWQNFGEETCKLKCCDIFVGLQQFLCLHGDFICQNVSAQLGSEAPLVVLMQLKGHLGSHFSIKLCPRSLAAALLLVRRKHTFCHFNRIQRLFFLPLREKFQFITYNNSIKAACCVYGELHCSQIIPKCLSKWKTLWHILKLFFPILYILALDGWLF